MAVKDVQIFGSKLNECLLVIICPLLLLGWTPICKHKGCNIAGGIALIASQGHASCYNSRGLYKDAGGSMRNISE